MENLTLSAPMIQYGFAGFSLLLLGVIVFQFTSIASLHRDTNRLLLKNTEAFIQFTGVQRELQLALQGQTARIEQLTNKLISRPCIAKGE